jgi:hypothetical protein
MRGAFTKFTVSSRIGLRKPLIAAILTGAVLISDASPLYSIVISVTPPSNICAEKSPSFSDKFMYGWSRATWSAGIDGKLTAFLMVP